MLAKRSLIEILHEILQMESSKKTHIMYHAALTYPQVTRYLHALAERGLIEKVTDEGEGVKKWLRKSEQGDKWNRCLIEGMIVLSETGARDEQTTPP